jgi:hypothetical protein
MDFEKPSLNTHRAVRKLRMLKCQVQTLRSVLIGDCNART